MRLLISFKISLQIFRLELFGISSRKSGTCTLYLIYILFVQGLKVPFNEKFQLWFNCIWTYLNLQHIIKDTLCLTSFSTRRKTLPKLKKGLRNLHLEKTKNNLFYMYREKFFHYFLNSLGMIKNKNFPPTFLNLYQALSCAKIK